MGAPASSGGSGGGGTVFIPPGQSQVASAMGDIMGPLAGVAGNAGAGTPGGWAYPQSQALVPQGQNLSQQFLTGSPLGQPTLFDQSSGLGYGSAMNAANLYSNMVGNTYGQVPGLTNAAMGGLSYLPQVMSNAFNPMYGQAVDSAANNPFYSQALAGAQQGANLGGQGANQMYGAGSTLLQNAFDPQSALFNRGEQRLTDRSSAINAMSGLARSPYGAGVTDQALSNYDLDWQDRQLGRQAQGSSAASPMLQAAPGMAASSAAMPSSVYMNNLQGIIAALNAQNQAGAQGVQGYGSLLSGAGQGVGQAQNILGASTSGLASSGMLPYQAGATMANNALTGLGNQNSLLSGATQLGNSQYQLPMQVMSSLMDYLSGGRQASQLSGNLGQMGFNQTAQGLGGLMSGANSLFGGSGGLFGGGGAGGMGAGLFEGIPGMAAEAGMMSFLPELSMLPFMFSDRRLKDDVSHIGYLPNGLPVHSFKYIWDDAPHIGLMADEVERVRPDAVMTGRGGFKMVDYARAMR